MPGLGAGVRVRVRVRLRVRVRHRVRVRVRFRVTCEVAALDDEGCSLGVLAAEAQHTHRGEHVARAAIVVERELQLTW